MHNGVPSALCRIPLCGQQDVLRSHNSGLGKHKVLSCLVHPTCKGVAGLGGVRRCCYGCSVILRNGINGRPTIGIKSDGISVHSPLRRKFHVIGRHGGRDVTVPTCKGVTRLGRIRGYCYGCAVILCNRIDDRTAIGIKGDGILIYSPLRRKCHIIGRHGGRDVTVPTRKGITRLGGIRGCCYGGAVILRNGINGRPAIDIKGDCVLIYCPLCCIRNINIRHGRCNIPPSGEGISNFNWIRGQHNVFSIFDDRSDVFLAIIRYKGHSVRIPLIHDFHPSSAVGGNDSLLETLSSKSLLSFRFCRCGRIGRAGHFLRQHLISTIQLLKLVNNRIFCILCRTPLCS